MIPKALSTRAMLSFACLLTGVFLPSIVPAQQPEVYADGVLHLHSSHTSFPDSGRSKGHVYDSVWYDPASHYADSSVLILIPKGLHATSTIDLVFWFHGWRNHIDSALQCYHLQQQFLASGRNAVLVMAETARNAPDSYGGKLEQAGMFHALVGDVLAALGRQNIIAAGCQPGHILLAGHSGAFRVMAHILFKGGMEISEVQLYDALYGETEKFLSWIQVNAAHRFINWYTNHGGGTDEVSIAFMEELKKQGMHLALTEESEITPEKVRSNSILFVHSPREHNDIIFNPDNFLLLLQNSPWLSAIPAKRTGP
jgi:hypothetical protein